MICASNGKGFKWYQSDGHKPKYIPKGEHFGMIDNSEYCKNMLSKLQFYISNGIIPTIHLITTFETKDNPLSATTVEKIVEEYFLH